ncbi:hypothetical protein [Cupriavidus gilardii]|uniref:hypothetical protein n=1 Tax=Cupriavidus gilardii TaxID=82541 RepID=UPI001FC91471|nr:hypothetical protein [Cupriavidus gilardii]
MEDLIRIQNEYDRLVLRWLRQQVGDDAVRLAATRLNGKSKPYLSEVCRALDIRPPARSAFRTEVARANRAVGERYLARIRQILSGSSSSAEGQRASTAASRPRHAPAQPALPFGQGFAFGGGLTVREPTAGAR